MDEEQKKEAWYMPAMRMFAQTSVWVAVPVILALFIGKWLDKKFGTAPLLFLILTGIAFLVSLFGIWKILSKYIKKIDEEYKNKKIENGKSNQSK